MRSNVPSELVPNRPPERRFWYLRTPEGNVYGPAAWDKLVGWVEQGRVTAECQLAAGEGRDWQPADEVFAQLKPKPAVPVHSAEAIAGAIVADPSPPKPQTRVYAPPPDDRPFLRRHRGGLILVLGAMGLCMACPIFSLMAWVMGSEDLRAIDGGQMDPAGRRQTLIGQRLGMVLSVIWIVGCMVALFVMLVRGT
jgi:hypothetical protein